ncbi:MAG TPA: Wzt carbohydrate-binding domain-containing protein [Bryobacteraceae bacterium]|nr:Wzt carbohydrate-binding domain-containing protein [Bryobacteraceae bacterium]
MAIVFRQVVCPPLDGFCATAPEGAVIGVIGEDGSGQGELLRLAAGVSRPPSGAVEAGEPRRLLGPDDALDFSAAAVLAMDHTLARHDALVRVRAAMAIDKLRRAGTTVLLVSHEEALLREMADEIWWLDGGKLAGRGDPEEMLRTYGGHIARRIREAGKAAPITPRWRRGDGRAQIEKLELLGESGQPTNVLRSGEPSVARVVLRFQAAVADPVAGLMIRSRAGMNVYGTNTELEGLQLGPCAAGQAVELTFAFRCELCNGEYTLTVASHDPDGVWHDWLEDALAFTVTDARYAAGVANLRATVRTCCPG